MADIARCYRRLFPFITGANEDLDGSDFDGGRIGFGTPPKWTCPPGPTPPDPLSRATGWRPVIASLGYVTLANAVPHRVTISLAEQPIPEAEYKGGTGFVAGARFREIVFDDVVNFVHVVGLPVPVAEENGNPFNLRIVTAGRLDPSSVVVDWEWARFSLDVTIDDLAELSLLKHKGRLAG